MRNGVHRKTKRTQYLFSICPTREDVCGLNTWHMWKITMVRLTLALCALGLVMIPSRHYRHFTPPTHRADLLANRQSENPMARTSVNPPPQTLHAESEPTTLARLWKLSTRLNTPNRFVPDLVRVSPTASDVTAGVSLPLKWWGGDILFAGEEIKNLKVTPPFLLPMT